MKETKNFKKGEIIFKKGDFEIFMYEIIMGEVAIYADFGLSSQRELTRLNNGDVFGELGLIDSKPRSATAVAITDTKAIAVDLDSFGEYFNDRPAKVISIMQNMGERIRDLTNDYMEACHTISDYLDETGENTKVSDNLMSRMLKFVGIYKNNQNK